MNLDAHITGFPLGGPQNGRFGFSHGDAALRESIWNILMTRPGERLMRPEFGAGLGRFIHEPNTETTRALIADAARTAITRWEPRIVLLGVAAQPDPVDRTLIRLAVDYRPKASSQSGRLELFVSLGGSF